jgi:large subunit GTPase 1
MFMLIFCLFRLSDVIVQIVDARNPLLFYCADLENYCKELDSNKLNLVLVNKSDYLSQRQRLAWLKYFESKNVRVVFWSAAIASTLLETEENPDGKDASRDRTESLKSENSESIDSQIDDDEDDDEEEDEDEDEDEMEAGNKFSLLEDEKLDNEPDSQESHEDDSQTEEETNDRDDIEVSDLDHEAKITTETQVKIFSKIVSFRNQD